MRLVVAVLLAAVLAACGGGGGDNAASSAACANGCATAAPDALTVADVERIISQAVQEAQARGSRATIAVVDRVGNVLAVFQMTGAAPTFTITSGRGVTGGLETINAFPSTLAAISKAITGAYLSSHGNAFTTRTASQIVQENFNPGENHSPGGPLFGVQFSSLACSDVTRVSASVGAGPKGSPLGLSADAGGLPIYKTGTLVGGVGVIADGVYGLDADVNDVDVNVDELVAVAAVRGYDAPEGIRAERISVDGRTLRYVDSEAIVSNPASAPPFAVLPGTVVFVDGYNVGVVVAGTAFGTPESGVRPNTDPRFAGLSSYVLDRGDGVNRYPPMAGTDGLMTEDEVVRILIEAITVANRARGQIRQPLGSSAHVSISVVDTNGAVIGFVRSPDAPVFGIDVAVQKARSALLFSDPKAALELAASAGASYAANMRSFIPGGTALSDGVAYSNRAIGNLARPFFPDGINGNGPGPLSRPLTNWSPFNDGLQFDLLVHLTQNIPPCTTLVRVPNGVQIFAGSVPIYRGSVLVGAIGISGDGIDQDDMVAFLGVANAGRILGTGIGNAPSAIRADQLGGLPGGRLRYVNCPVAPFLDTNATNVCDGI